MSEINYTPLLSAMINGGFKFKRGSCWEHEEVLPDGWRLIAVVSTRQATISGFVLTDGERNHVFQYNTLPRLHRPGLGFPIALSARVAELLQPLFDWIEGGDANSLAELVENLTASGEMERGENV